MRSTIIEIISSIVEIFHSYLSFLSNDKKQSYYIPETAIY
jgi:hypothetical protein